MNGVGVTQQVKHHLKFFEINHCQVKRIGDARVALIGFPSVGKSTLLSSLTGDILSDSWWQVFWLALETDSQQAAYEFTTLTCIPGNIMYNDCKIQLLDLPGKQSSYLYFELNWLSSLNYSVFCRQVSSRELPMVPVEVDKSSLLPSHPIWCWWFFFSSSVSLLIHPLPVPFLSPLPLLSFVSLLSSFSATLL